MCLPRALVVCQGWDDHKAGLLSRKQWRRLYDSNLPLQGAKATELIGEMGLDFYQCSLLNNITRYEEHLKANIVIISGSQQNSIIYPEKLNEAYTKFYYLYYIDTAQSGTGHFHSIKSITGLMNVAYFCHGCMSGYQHSGEHHCQATCMKCKSTKCIPTTDKKLCMDCGV